MPKINKNLESIFLNKNGFQMVFEFNKVFLPQNGMYMGKRYVLDRLIKLDLMVMKPKNNKASSSAYFHESFNLWPSQLGHVNYIMPYVS